MCGPKEGCTTPERGLRQGSPIHLFIFRVKYTFQPSTHAEVRFSTFNYETGQKHPSTIKTGQIWSLADFKSGFLFSGGAEILNYFFEHLNVLKWKNSKLQSCRSHWDLQFTYKNYLHPTSYRRVFYFLKFESHHATKFEPQGRAHCAEFMRGVAEVVARNLEAFFAGRPLLSPVTLWTLDHMHGGYLSSSRLPSAIDQTSTRVGWI